MASSDSPERVKDVLLEHVLRDVKGLQGYQSDLERMEDCVTTSNSYVQALCEHFDRILLHGLRSSEMGYWAMVKYFTRKDAVHTINTLPAVKTNVGRGRAWLYLALNEQSLESYMRMFHDNQSVLQDHYLRDSFMRDVERLLILQTVVAGLDFISFELSLDSDYFDYGATRATSTVGTLQSNDITPDVQPTFISSMTPNANPPEPWSTDPPVESSTKPPSTPSSTSTTKTTKSKGKKKKTSSVPEVHVPQVVGVASTQGGVVSQGDQREAELRSSFSPHRTLSQYPSSEQATLERSGSFAASGSHTLPLLGSEVAQDEDGDDALVERKSKSKSKKKKKKKKPKGSELEAKGKASDTQPAAVGDDKSQTLEQSDDQPSLKRSDSRTSTGHDSSSKLHPAADGAKEAESGGVAMARVEADSASKKDVASKNPFGEEDSPKTGSHSEPKTGGHSEGTESEERTVLTYRVKRTPQPWEEEPEEGEEKEDFFSKESGGQNFTPFTHDQDIMGEYLEECDTGFGRGVEPVPLPQQGSSKRLSLADELEMAMNDESADTKQEVTSPADKQQEEASTAKQQEVTSSEPLPSILQPDDMEEQATAGATPHTVSSPSSAQSSTHQLEDLRYDGSPLRPREITEKDRKASDIEIDDNAKVVITLEILHSEEEKLHRLIQVNTPTGVGQQQTCYILITSEYTYILKRDGVEGHYSCEVAIKYSNFEHITMGLGWQSLHLVYRALMGGSAGSSSPTKEYIILTGSEAVSRSIVDTIRATAAKCPGFMRSVPLNRDDESRMDAIEKELIKLGSETSMEVEQYLLVNWEQLSGGEGPSGGVGEGGGASCSGNLQVKTTNLIGIASWRMAYFSLKDGKLYQFASEDDDEAKYEYRIRNCGGCMRATAENKPFAISILGSDRSVVVVVAANSEEELTQWMQALCVAQLEIEKPGSPTIRKTCFFCALLLTQDKIHVLQEDWMNKSVQLVASCAVTDVNDISVDRSLPLYCTISYDDSDEPGVWLICFNTEYELGKFEAALGSMWRDQFEVDLQFSEISDPLTQQRGHRAVELMQGSRFRSDSMTRGRTEFTYSGRY